MVFNLVGHRIYTHRECQSSGFQRPGTPAEVASTVRFFIENDYVTGQVVAVDGGRSLL